MHIFARQPTLYEAIPFKYNFNIHSQRLFLEIRPYPHYNLQQLSLVLCQRHTGSIDSQKIVTQMRGQQIRYLPLGILS